MSGRIIQFGTSRFLQAHVALFVHEARLAGQDVGPIAVVQASGSAARAGRVAAFGAPGGYPVLIRGMENGRPVEREVRVTSVDRGLSAAGDWAALVHLFIEEAAYVVSNMGDTGYDVPASDRAPSLFEGGVPASFPAKLAVLLHARWQAGGAPITILPCELINQNARVLQSKVLDLALAGGAPDAFLAWLRDGVIWADTLVDRIVSAPLDPVGAVAEPYAIWVIEKRPGLVLPCEHPCILLADDLEPHERLKLHILNLGHTVLADFWQSENRPADETVRAILSDAAVREKLAAIYDDEVLPGFARRGMGDQARAYLSATMDRFRNPFLDHRIADIAQNHAAKVERRIGAFLRWSRETAALEAPVLTRLVARHERGHAA